MALGHPTWGGGHFDSDAENPFLGVTLVGRDTFKSDDDNPTERYSRSSARCFNSDEDTSGEPERNVDLLGRGNFKSVIEGLTRGQANRTLTSVFVRDKVRRRKVAPSPRGRRRAHVVVGELELATL